MHLQIPYYSSKSTYIQLIPLNYKETYNQFFWNPRFIRPIFIHNYQIIKFYFMFEIN
jgi:hypothetical protein